MRRVLTFYRFVPVTRLGAVRAQLQQVGDKLGLRGTILIAAEGVNGTLVGPTEALAGYQQTLVDHFGDLPFKWSDLQPENQGFHRFKVRIKPEIVSFGVPDLDVAQGGEHVDAKTWNKLLDNPDVLVIDTRNRYEVDIGSFPNALSPETDNFRQFPQWVAQHLDPQENRPVAMFCTGGIRCEKASAFVKAQGFDQVYQLDGGILKYLEDTQGGDNRWQGECFVFDQRVSVDAGLNQGRYQQCYACRHPLSADELASDAYEKGVSCPHCIQEQSAQRVARLRHRQMQVDLAQARGGQHIGKTQSRASKK